MIIINLERTYLPEYIDQDLPIAEMQFYSPQRDGSKQLIYVRLSQHPDKFLPGVYNLALGPLDEDGEINDAIRLNHADTGKVFSTAIFFSYSFLLEHGDFTIGLDGSDDLRAFLYHSMFTANRKHLSKYFITIGVDWYVKLLRNKIDVERKKDGTPFFKPITEPFNYARPRTELYNYYMFHLKK